MLSDTLKDVVYAFRTLLKNPGFTVVAVLALALGIGANTAVFSVIDALINFPLPMEDVNRVTFLYSENPAENATQNPVSMDDFVDWRRQSHSFEVMVAGTADNYNVVAVGEPQRVAAFRFSSGFFAMTGKPLTLGRGFLSEETRPGNEHVVVLSHSFWQQKFAGDPKVLGTEVSLDGVPHTVVGVAAPDFFFPNRVTALWTPLVVEEGVAARDERTLLVMARLRPGVSSTEATAELGTIARQIEQANSDTNEGWTAIVQTTRETLMSGAALAVTLLYGSITFVLLIACANVANLLISRATVREKEIALRTTLGAGRLRLVRQLLTESFVLSTAGGVLGLLLGAVGMTLLRSWLAPDPNIGFVAEEMTMSTTVLLHTVAISVLAGVLFGLAPAVQTSRTDLQSHLKEGGRSAGGGARRGRLRSILVVAEVTMALTLLGTSGALIRAFSHIYSSDPGFNPSSLLTFQLALPESDYSEPLKIASFYDAALERLEEIPGVVSAAVTTSLPLTMFPGVGTPGFIPEGSDVEPDEVTANVVDLVVSPGYFETMEIPIVQGRGLRRGDSVDTFPVAVVSRATVERYWPQSDPLGKRFRFQGEDGSQAAEWVTVVGVSGDLQSHIHSIRTPELRTPHVFRPYAQVPRAATAFAIRTRVAPSSLSSSAREAIWDVDPDQPLDDLNAMESIIARVDAQNWFFVRVLSGLSFIALLLAGIGIYGVIAFAVNQRSHEIGVRMALGATPRDVLTLVVRQGALLTVIGLILGVTGSIAFVRFMGNQLEGIALSNASGAMTYVVVSLILLFVAELASFVPARRAVRVDPLITLRYE